MKDGTATARPTAKWTQTVVRLVYIEFVSYYGVRRDPYGDRLHRARLRGLAHHGDHAIRAGWISRGANVRRGARDHRTFTVHFRDHRRRPSNYSWRQHHAADPALREDSRRRLRSDAAARGGTGRQRGGGRTL